MGLLDIFGGKDGEGLLGGNAFEKFLRMQALNQGDYRTAAAITGNIRENKADRAEQQAIEQEVKRVRDAMRRAGYSDDQITMAMTNPKAFGTNFNQQFGTQNVAPDTSLVTGGPGGPRVTFKGPTAPTTLQKDAQWYTQASPAERQALDAVRPIINNGPYGQQFIPRTSIPSGDAGGPRPGTVEDGFIFKGGDPSDPNNWQPVDNVAGQDIPIPRLGGR